MAEALSQPGGAQLHGAPTLEELVESEQRFRKLVEALPDAILVHTDGRIVFVNPFCVRLHKANSPEKLLGRNISEFIRPDYLAEIERRIEQCYATGTASIPMEMVVIACDGSPAAVEAVAIPICWNGAPAIEVVLRDIKKRKEAEQEAHEWQKRLELARKSGLKIGLWDWNLVDNTVMWSEESYRQFGFTPESFSGHVEDAASRIHPEDRERVAKIIREVLSGKAEEYAAQYRLVRPDGTVCWIDAHGVMVQNGSKHMIGIGVDITDLKRTEQSLQESEEKYRLLLNSTAEAIYGIDLNGNCTFCNPATVKLLGYNSTEELLGKNMHALLHHSHADGAPYPDDECEIYVAVRQGRATHVANEVLWRADRTSFPAEYWSYPIHKNGQLVGAVVTFLDRSDRKQAEHAIRQSEEKYRKLFENATYGIFLSKPDGTLLDVNPAMVAMLGYDSKEELLSRNLDRDIYNDPTDRTAILSQFRNVARVENAETQWRRKDGKILTVRLNGAAFLGEDGKVSRYNVIVDDITERRNLEAQYRQAQKMEAVGLLAGGISHDFNNLLGVIMGNADLLLQKMQPGPDQRHLQAIKKAGGSAAQLVRQLLAFSRKQVLYPTVLDLNSIITDVGKILRRLIGEDVHIATHLEAGLGSVRADRGQVEQILMNLATNARDAMPSGGTFSIRTANAELGSEDVARYCYVKPGRYVRLSVGDTGMGMSEEIRSRVFEPFFTTKEQGRGTGLGLSTVYGIVKQSGGYIWVSSSPGAGATFDIYLPRVDEKPLPASPNLETQTDYPRGSETILVLEDDECLRDITCEFLTESGYKVLQAARGDVALELARQCKDDIQLLVTDVVLPGVSGPSAAASLKESHPETQVLYVSGYAEVPVAQKLVAEGAVLLQKPVSRMDLLKKVHEVLHLRQGCDARLAQG